MKKYIFALAAVALALPAVSMAITVDGVVDAGYGAAFATDAVISGDGTEGGGGTAVMDYKDMFVTVDAGTLYVALTIAGDVSGGGNWGKYAIFLNVPELGATTTTDAWGRAVTSAGSNAQFHCWVDGGGGAGFDKWNGASFEPLGAGNTFAFAAGAESVVEIGIPLANLNNPAGNIQLAAWNTGNGGTDNGRDFIPSTNPNTSGADWATVTNIANFSTFAVPSSVSEWMTYED